MRRTHRPAGAVPKPQWSFILKPLGVQSKPRRNLENERKAAYQPDAGDATGVSTVRGDCTVGGFDGRQKLTEWAPLIFVRSAAEAALPFCLPCHAFFFFLPVGSAFLFCG